MTTRVLISGSVAYDTIMVFDGHFKDHILPERVHMLNVSFLTPSMKREFGGCAANIAYTLKGLGGSPTVLAAVGRDGGDYVERLAALGIDTSSILRCDDLYTAQAFITTDLSDNQITAFHPGAMGRAHEVAATGPAAWGIVAPNGKDAMLRPQEFLLMTTPGLGKKLMESFIGQRRFDAKDTSRVIKGGYKAVDVISLTADHPQKDAIRAKFLSEHTHDEDEVRFFHEGAGNFVLHVNGRVYDARCERGDLISVPTGTLHWFDAGPEPHVTALRVFTATTGWTPHYTGTDMAERFPAATA
jgi:cupin superfamily acireductone dioxygenase involved in methionine salvage